MLITFSLDAYHAQFKPIIRQAPRRGILPEPKTLGEHLRRARMARGLTQRQAAGLLGVNPWTVLNWERGHTEPPAGFMPRILQFLGTAPIAEPVLHWWDRLGLTISQGYSMSENCAYAFLNYPGKNRFGSVGQSLPGSEVKIAENGEILTRSQATMAGYYIDPERTAETIDSEGWLHTGDKGYRP